MAGRRIYLVGSAGYPYYGDELIAAGWLRYLAATEPDAEVWVDCPQPGGASLLLGHLHPKVRFTDTLFRVCWAAPSEDPAEVVGFADRAARTPGFGVPHRAAGIDLLHTADVVHVVGGGYVNEIWPRHLGLLAAAGAVRDAHGARAFATGHGLLPRAADEDVLARAMSGLEVVDTRDEQSAALVPAEQRRHTGDDGLLALDAEAYDRRETPSTMMCLQSDLLDGDPEQLASSALETAKAWGLRGDKVGYVETIPGQDRVVFDLIAAELPGMRFYPFTEVWREGLPARRGQRWLTTRYAVHLAAAAVGAWGVAFVAKKGYNDVEHESLVAAGSRWSVATAGEVAPAAHGEAGFGGRAEELRRTKRALADELYAR
jgi:hypothetical protein